jgi:hypothetical protein
VVDDRDARHAARPVDDAGGVGPSVAVTVTSRIIPREPTSTMSIAPMPPPTSTIVVAIRPNMPTSCA